MKSVKQFNLQMSRIYSGYIFEARGLLKDTLEEYKGVEKEQRETFGEKNRVTL